MFCAGSWSTAGVFRQSGEKAEALENELKVTSFAPLREKNSTRLSLTKKSRVQQHPTTEQMVHRLLEAAERDEEGLIVHVALRYAHISTYTCERLQI